jgi:sacsin
VDPGLAEHQGPALLVYNDAVFSENDFESLKRLGDSAKATQKLATGKFGLGFNSVFSFFNYTETRSMDGLIHRRLSVDDTSLHLVHMKGSKRLAKAFGWIS